MWQWLMDILPDMQAGTLEIRDLVSFCLGALGIYLAALAIKASRVQGRIAELQAEIARKQDRWLEQERSKVARLTLSASTVMMLDEKVRFRLSIANIGTASVQEYKLYLKTKNAVARAMFDSERGAGEWQSITSPPDAAMMSRFVSQSVFVGQKNRICEIWIPENLLPTTVYWRVAGDNVETQSHDEWNELVLERLPDDMRTKEELAESARMRQWMDLRARMEVRLPKASDIGDEDDSALQDDRRNS